jgi:hypothetical protein
VPGPPKIVLTCAGCADDKLIAEVHIDADGDPVLKARPGSAEFSMVEPFELAEGRLAHVRTETERVHPRAVTVRCPKKGHPIEFLVSPMVQRLGRMRPGEIARHAG